MAQKIGSKALAIGGALILCFLLIFLFLDELILAGFFNYFENTFVTRTGMDRWLAKAIAFVLMLPLIWAVPKAWSLNSATRRTANVVLTLTMSGFCVLMFALTYRDVFDRNSGNPLKFYADTPEGRRFFNHPGFDPKYGLPLLPATAEIMRQEENRSQGRYPKRMSESSTSEIEFFDSITKSPKVWFYRNDAGMIELYNSDGVHPTYGTALLPVTREVVREYEDQQKQAVAALEVAKKQAKRRKYIRTEDRVGSQKSLIIAVVAANLTGHPDAEMASLLEKSLMSQQLKVASGLLTTAFVTDGLFQRVSNGDSDLLADLNLERSCDFLVLADLSTSEDNPNADLPDVVSLTFKLRIHVWDCRKLAQSQQLQLSVKGSGFSRMTAQKQGIERLGVELTKIEWQFAAGEEK